MNIETDRVREVFLAALKVPPAGWDAYLREACANEQELRNSVERLLQAHLELGSITEQSAGLIGSTVDSPPPERSGTVIAPYKLVEPIGEGGMGTVWMAQQTEPVRRVVALKLIKAGMDSKPVIARFEAERQALALMDHPNIAKVLDAGTTDRRASVPACSDGTKSTTEDACATGRPYFVMELVKGVPITRYCDEHHLTPRQRLELFVPVCQAVQHAHQKGIIHRDLKPSNVLVALYDGKPVPKIIDFGVAKATGQMLTDKTLVTGFGAIIGTLEYMSPEQAEINQLDIDTRSDIYSLGVLLYELLTGSPPFTKKDLEKAGMLEMLRVIREQEPTKPSTKLSTAEGLPTLAANRGTEPAKLSKLVRGELDWIVMKALEKDRNRRYETANGFAMDLLRYLGDEPVLACPPSAGYRLKKFARRNQVRLTLVGMAGAFLALLGWALVNWGARRAATHQVVIQALAEADDWQKQGQYPEALAAARRADALAAGSAASRELRERARRRRADLELVHRLDEVRLGPAADVKDEHFDMALADQRHGAEFRAAGLAVDELAPEASAELVRATTVAVELAAALDYWASARRATRGTEDSGWRRLLEVARRADPDEWRCRLRDALAARDRQALEDLSRVQEVAGLPAASLAVLGNVLCRLDAPSQAVELLRAAQRRHPHDFWINHHLGWALQELKPAQLEEAIRFYTVAVALRPQSPGTRLNFGAALRQKGKLDEALAAYREAIRLKPDYASAHSALGVALADQGKLAEAEPEYREGIRLKPDDAATHYNLGNLLRCQGKMAEAQAEYREAIRLKPDYALAHVNLGFILQGQGKPAEEEAEYREAIRLRPDFAEAHLNLGILLQEQGKLAEAEAKYREAMKLNPDLVEARLGLGNLLQRRDKFVEAEALFRAAIRLKPEDARAHGRLGSLWLKQGKLAEAEAEFREAIRLKPDNAEAWSDRGLVYANLEKFDQAIADYSKAIEIKPDDANTWHNRGVAHADLQQFDKAIADYSKAIELKPDFAEAHNNLGLSLCHKGQFDEAVAEFGEAVRVKPDYAEAWYYRGKAHHDLRQYGEAIADYSKAIELNPDYAEAWYHRGLAHKDYQQYEKAVADWSKAIEIKKDSVDAWANRGTAYSMLKQYDKAISDYRKVVELSPRDAGACNKLTWLLASCPDPKLRDERKALEFAKKAVEIAPQSLDAWQMLGWVHYRIGAWKASIDALEKSCVLQKGGDCGQWIVMAMAHWKLSSQEDLTEPEQVRHRMEARHLYEQSAKQIDGWGGYPHDDVAQSIWTFREEAVELMGLKKERK